jgi:hypothetical protein
MGYVDRGCSVPRDYARPTFVPMRFLWLLAPAMMNRCEDESGIRLRSAVPWSRYEVVLARKGDLRPELERLRSLVRHNWVARSFPDREGAEG